MSQQLKRVRLFKGLSQQAVGNVLSVSNHQYSKFESGLNRISASQLLKIANEYSVPVELLFSDVEFQ
ncbi:helix-turn-helix domain-containing protein [Colwellia sp. BRX8-9]|uniref:helix-turn-helix domain-containing protein n=1 Tax=Colwellia sp. BRX8-9 TaxID=2759831 RepID=UPI0038560415